MSDLTGKKPKNTYPWLLNVGASELTPDPAQVTLGNGVATPLSMSDEQLFVGGRAVTTAQIYGNTVIPTAATYAEYEIRMDEIPVAGQTLVISGMDKNGVERVIAAEWVSEYGSGTASYQLVIGEDREDCANQLFITILEMLPEMFSHPTMRHGFINSFRAARQGTGGNFVFSGTSVWEYGSGTAVLVSIYDAAVDIFPSGKAGDVIYVSTRDEMNPPYHVYDSNGYSWTRRVAATATTIEKADPRQVIFKVVDGVPVLAQDITVSMPGGKTHSFSADTEVTYLAAPIAGKDYAVHYTEEGVLVAFSSFTPPDGGALIGGFHYAPCENSVLFGAEYHTAGTNFTAAGVKVATSAFHFTPYGSTDREFKGAVSAGHALPAGTIPAGKWGCYALAVATGGAITVTAAADNATGYASEALAVVRQPLVTGKYLGYFTVLGKSGEAFVAGTDGLKGGTGGNVASETNFYPASAQTPAINPYSFWDLHWRPSCPDPRGMFLYAGREWIDIYLCNDNPDVLGTSAYNAQIADGSSRPKIPALYGGNGVTTMPNFDWYSASEIAAAYGKDLVTVETMIGATIGASSGVATIADPAKTILMVGPNASSGLLTSRWGMIQSFGAMWVWTSTKGSDGDKMALHGGAWNYSGSAGPRYIGWANAATGTNSSAIGARFRSDHLTS